MRALLLGVIMILLLASFSMAKPDPCDQCKRFPDLVELDPSFPNHHEAISASEGDLHAFCTFAFSDHNEQVRPLFRPFGLLCCSRSNRVVS